MRRLLAILLVLSPLACAGPAAADGDPIMPLAEVHAGQRCTALTVVRGTTITSFDVEVLDVVAGDAASSQPYILFRASGPAVDATGIGPGFSGSPISCPDGDGVPRTIGAVSEGIGEYGNKVALATPIESVIGEPVDPPTAVKYRPRLLASAHPLATPLSVSGLSGPVAQAFQRAAARAHRAVYTAPAAPRASDFGVQELRPGASVSAGLSSGDLSVGSIGTVTYTDGDKLWAFGHPLDGAGRRSLFLQDAYVYTVINNPVGSADLQTYKYAVAGHDVGVLTNDGIAGIAGRLGTLPPDRFVLKITARDLDTGRLRSARVNVADEVPVGLPTGGSALTQVGPLAVAQVAYTLLDGAPAHQSGSMCVSITVRESPKPLRFCNTYVGGGGGTASVGGGPLVEDFAAAATAMDSYRFGPLHITGVEVGIRLRRDQRQAFLLRAKAPRVVHRGHDTHVRLTLREVNGPIFGRTIKVHVPSDLGRGDRGLVFTGTAADLTASPDSAMATVLQIDDSGPVDDTGPRTLDDLRVAIARIRRGDGLRLRLGVMDSQIYRDPQLRISGSVETRTLVR